MPELSQDEIARYARHLVLKGFGAQAQVRLKAARLLVVGLGGLGCPVAGALCGAGVGTLGLVDDDTVLPSNLPRQLLYDTHDIGRDKTDAAERRLRALNPHCHIEPHPMRIDADNALALVSRYDIIVDCMDAYTPRAVLAKACHNARKPLISGAVAGYDGYITHYQSFARGADGLPNPTFFCLYPTPPREEAQLACETLGVLAPVTQLVGSFMALEVMRYMQQGVNGDVELEERTLLIGNQLWIDALSLRISTMAYAWNPQNPLNGMNTTS